MIAKTPPATQLAHALAQSRLRTDALFGLVRPEAFYDRPVPERHRTIFYFGHLEAFDWNLVSRAAGVPSFHPEFDQ
ncbi:MAG: ergothioneine biosynthesis protein EgtB, partial [Nitrospirota bacterium]